MKIKRASIFVNNQDKALKFYTEVLGFVKKNDIPLGEFKWLTVVSPDGSGEIELLLEPNNNPAAQIFQAEIYKQKIPGAVFFTDDIAAEFERLEKLDVVFTTKITNAGPVSIAVFDDTCGNLIQICQLNK